MEDKEYLLRVPINAAHDLKASQTFIQRQFPQFQMQSLQDLRNLIAALTK
jgi:hypothetical protein